ncbi:RagB/SusD family nutrient uptake outer membrane protein [Proteiniphilum sp. UBA5280]|uniref:RagB/SusD family nutrient uptake outer membrane protein n=1 Tax=Proteiniphilum sp. UBA5280 TaxID=1947273 RepID=UPI00257C2225|nr:RagB/SusD family nutrient uptake outer membrane protein [Proteiniphilum sp. UBA5280]
MKKIMPIWIVISIVFFVSCDDFLERAPSGLLDEKAVFSNLNNAEGFLNNAYREVPQLVYGGAFGGHFNLGSGTDEGAHMTGEAYTTKSFNYGDWNPAQFPLMWCWHAYYAAIRRTNTFIKNYDLIPEEVGGVNFGDKRRRLYGEAHALRAYYYFLLFSMWGEVPYYRAVLLPGEDDIYLQRTDVSSLINFISDDIRIAEEYLSPQYTSSEFGRFTSVAAKALRARLLLYYASKLSNSDNDLTRWSKAAEAAKEAIDFAESNGYALSLTDNANGLAYERIFKEMTNSEILWSSLSPYEGDGRIWNGLCGALADNGWAGEAPIQEMVDSYEMINGELPVLGYDENNNPILNEASGYNPQNPYINRDKRFYQTIIYHGSHWKGRTIDLSYPNGNYYDKNYARTNYYWKKYMQEEFNMATGSGFSVKRFIVFRLSELYLNYAETLNESLASPDKEVYSAINIIRGRAGLPDLPFNLTKETMREKIRNERKVELAMENHRFFDVRRWMIAEKVDVGYMHKVHIENGKFSYPTWEHPRIFDKKKHYLFPIPQTEIDKNRDLLKQNPGW